MAIVIPKDPPPPLSPAARELLAACAAAPDDDELRQVWADEVGGERGELVVLQCAIARGDGSPQEVGARFRRERELMQSAVEWSHLVGYAKQCLFRRGFVAAIEVDVSAFLEHVEAFAERAPLASGLTLARAVEDERSPEPAFDRHVQQLDALFSHTAYQNVAALALPDIGFWGGETWYSQDARVIALATELGALVQLRALSIDRLSPTGGQALVASAQLGKLERLVLSRSDLDQEAARTLIAVMPNLRALELDGELSVATLAQVLPTTVRHLMLPRLGKQPIDGELAALAATPIAPALETLTLGTSTLKDPSLLAAFPNLRTLDLRQVALSRGSRQQLARCALPSLRALRLDDHERDDAWLLALARTFGPQLEQLEIVVPTRPAGVPDEVTALVAGDVHIAFLKLRWLLHAGFERRTALWSAPVVSCGYGRPLGTTFG